MTRKEAVDKIFFAVDPSFGVGYSISEASPFYRVPDYTKETSIFAERLLTALVALDLIKLEN